VAAVIITLPMIVIFFLGQRYFVEGIATTGRKG
jgi:multiple sugar transport system permease protein